MPNIMAGSLDGRFAELAADRLEVVSVVVNNVCNLRCKHCYLEPETSHSALSHEEWLQVLGSVVEQLQPAVLSFAGKEVFADRDSVDLLLSTIRLRNSAQSPAHRRTRIGVITNGTLLQRYHDKLLSDPPDYIDVSIDGLPSVHDDVRGTGSFERLEPNLQWLTQEFKNPVWVTHTLFGTNLASLADFVSTLATRHGLRRFSVGLYHPLSYTDQSLRLRPGRPAHSVERMLQRLASIGVPAPVEVVLDLGVDDTWLFPDLQRSGLIAFDGPFSSRTRELGNGVSLTVNATRILTGLWRAVRISPQGHWLASEDLLFPKEYDHRAVTMLREHGCSATAAYRFGLGHLRASIRSSQAERQSLAREVEPAIAV